MTAEPDPLDWWVYLVAAAIVVVICALFHVLIKATAKDGSFGKKHGIWGLVMGQDGRTSTSKLNAALWTLALVFAFAALIIDGRDFIDHLQEEYLLLLGGPYAAAIGAKAITSSKDDSGAAPKDELSEQEAEQEGISNRIAEVVSDDSGQVDLGDFQYFAFTVVALVFFFAKFFTDPGAGLPEIPGTLVGLTSASALAYLTKKGVYKQEATLKSVSPKEAGPGAKVKIFGANLLSAAQRAVTGASLPVAFDGQVLFGTEGSDDVKVMRNAGSTVELEARVPESAAPGDAEVSVIPAIGMPTEAKPFEVTSGVEVISASPSRIVLGETTELTVSGNGFVAEDGAATEHNAVKLDGVELSSSDWTPRSVRAQLIDSAQDLKLRGLDENQEGQLVVINHLGRQSEALSVWVDAP